MNGLARLAIEDLRAAPRRVVVSGLGIALGACVLMTTVGLGLGARRVVLDDVVQQLPIDIVEVVPRTVDLGLFKLDTDRLFGATRLNAETLARLEAMPQVEAAYPKLEVKLPMGARGGSRLFGRRLYADLFMTGVPPALVADDVREGFVDSPDHLPVLISDQLIEIYNKSVAPVVGTPHLTAATLAGFEFEVSIGRSLMLGRRGARSEGVERARIVGASRHAMRLGATVPLATARRLIKKYGVYGAPESFAAIVLKARSAEDVPALTQAVSAMGLAVDDAAERTSNLMTLLIAVAGLLGCLILALAGLNIAHSFLAILSERRYEFAVMRAVGATRRDILSLVLLQACMLGAIGGMVGAAATHVIGGLGDWGARLWLPDFPFKPDTFFDLPLWLHGAVVGAAVLAALVGALWPALRASGTSVVRALADG